MSVAYSNPGLTLSSDGKSFTLNNPMSGKIIPH
jgi:hypothetical protein